MKAAMSIINYQMTQYLVNIKITTMADPISLIFDQQREHIDGTRLDDIRVCNDQTNSEKK